MGEPVTWLSSAINEFLPARPSDSSNITVNIKLKKEKNYVLFYLVDCLIFFCGDKEDGVTMATIFYFVKLSQYFWQIFNVIVSVDGGDSAT